MKENVLNRITKETFDFLWYSYFGIRKEDTDEKAENGKKPELITICAQRAYLDLCRTLEFVKDGKKDKNNISEEERKRRKAFRDAICGIIVHKITDLFSSTEQKGFNVKHKEICTAITDEAKDYKDKNGNKLLKEKFSDGQAQKWLNMTVKYMYLMGYWKDEFDGKQHLLHVPVDSIIIKAVWGNDDIKLPLIKDKLLKDGTRGAYSDEKIIKWSQWNYDDYENFQSDLKDFLGEKTPLEWEAEVWMGAANENK